MSALGLSVREFARESGLPVYRVRKMVAAGTLRADTSTSRPMIPRAELERVFGAPQPADPEAARADLVEVVREAVRAELTAFYGRLSG